MPEVSIIMNCRNGARFLPGTLACLKSQTFQNFEIIFWDNGSTDASLEIAKAYGPKLRWFRSEKTVPLGAARNLAIARARGRHIAFLDCDDLWRPHKLEKQMALVRANPRLGLVTTDTEIFDGQKKLCRLFQQSPPARGMVFRELVQRQWISMSSALASREALDATRYPGSGGLWFDPGLNMCEEADVFYRIAHDYELDHVDEPLTAWRVHPGSSTFRKFGQFAAETLIILQRMRTMYPGFDLEYPDLASLLTQRAAFQQAIALWRAGESSKARAAIAPHLGSSRKYRLFWLASFLPGCLFDAAGRIYFRLPAAWRR